jgi:hypothetical protein
VPQIIQVTYLIELTMNYVNIVMTSCLKLDDLLGPTYRPMRNFLVQMESQCHC